MISTLFCFSIPRELQIDRLKIKICNKKNLKQKQSFTIFLDVLSENHNVREGDFGVLDRVVPTA